MLQTYLRVQTWGLRVASSPVYPRFQSPTTRALPLHITSCSASATCPLTRIPRQLQRRWRWAPERHLRMRTHLNMAGPTIPQPITDHRSPTIMALFVRSFPNISIILRRNSTNYIAISSRQWKWHSQPRDGHRLQHRKSHSNGQRKLPR